MSEFKVGRSNNEVRNLKKWKGSRISQLALWVRHLETAFDVNSLAGQVLQSSKRKFSEFVPKIVTQDINTEVEFREVRITWKAPRGLRFFLFYELQLSLTENFAQFDTFSTPDPFFVFPGLADGTTYYARIRVLNKDQLFGPWSDTQSIKTPRAQSFGFTDGTETDLAIVRKQDSFELVYQRTYNAIGGSLYYGIDYYVSTLTGDGTDPHQSDMEFQWIENGEQLGQNFLVTTMGALGEDVDVKTTDIGTHATDALILPQPFTLTRKGAFLQKVHDVSEGEITIQIRARQVDWHPTANDWIQNPALGSGNFNYDIPGLVKFKNFFIFESLLV